MLEISHHMANVLRDSCPLLSDILERDILMVQLSLPRFDLFHFFFFTSSAFQIDMVTCSAHCRANFDPSSEESFPCEGFNFRAGRNPVCEFFPATGTNENHTKSLKIEEVPTFYYEKVCLQIAKRCEESAYMFDVKNGYRIDETPIRIINASAEGQCMEECVKIQCMSFGFHHAAKRCSFYNSTRRDAVIIKDVKMDYYENNCVHRIFLKTHF
ncbi:hypothetical protein CRE_23871 [Caenorhabditis remanei]|uniref:Apple domain-containing protein n=1 Tax=Caenorhabditis remanei TaxID=31234 RepID=E3NWP9_CAERE|nr:hypothetical protein CRE_23871 [Caenorhabditis remanei]